MKPNAESLTYTAAGVDREAAAVAKSRIAELARSTFTEAVEGEFGSFGGCFKLANKAGGHTLVASADGVGTKLKIAVRAGVHDSVGYDLVAHCANDILAQGALPLFFLDYLALGRMDVEVVEAVVDGVARGCRDVGAVLLGGETAEMPGMYQGGEYDLAGFIVGCTVGSAPLNGHSIRPGDALIGLTSSGLHTNGYSLVRRILFEMEGLHADSIVSEWGCTVAEELLRPHRAYVAVLRATLQRGDLLGLAHITGGGIPGNVPRMLPSGCGARIDADAWDVPPVFKFLQARGRVAKQDMWRTFNMGIGMVVAVKSCAVTAVLEELRASGADPRVVGEVVSGSGVCF